MHEFTVVKNIVQTADQFAREHQIENVRQLTVQIGVLTGVIPQYVRMYYQDLIEGTSLEGSQLQVEEIPAEAFCRHCGEVFDPGMEGDIRCPSCGSAHIEILHGRELTIKEIGYL